VIAYTSQLAVPKSGCGCPFTIESTYDMVKIRLTRGGAKKRPFDQRAKRDGRALERLGYYNPIATATEKRVEVDVSRVQHWVGQGAQMTDKVRQLVREASAAQAAA
jgi:small subunit ribosomal protein S16